MRSTSTSPSAARTSTCAAVPAPVTSTSHPRHLDGRLRTLDTGWFAKRDPFAYLRPDPPVLAEGGDAFLESTPAVLPIYQARAGQRLMLALRVDRVRAHSLALQRQFVALLAERGVVGQGGTEERGAFVTVTHPDAEAWSTALAAAGVVTDARGPYLRLCPDLLTTQARDCRCGGRGRLYAPALRMIRRTTRTRVSTNTAASAMPTRTTWCGLTVTASLRIASPLRMPRKLENTVPTTSRRVAWREAVGQDRRDGMTKTST